MPAIARDFPMLITSEQMAALEDERKGRFLARVGDFIATRAPARPEPRVLEALYRRGQAYGLSSEQEFAGYIVLGWASRAHEAAQDPDWIVEVMRDPHRTTADKVAALFERADRFPRRGA